jgi:hypothetical protein
VRTSSDPLLLAARLQASCLEDFRGVATRYDRLARNFLVGVLIRPPLRGGSNLILGAMAVVRWAARKGAAPGSWLARMLAKKPRLVVAIALANKMARSVWAMLSKGEEYRESALAPA